jgi:hypothetical protein
MLKVWKCHLLHLLQSMEDMNSGNDEEMECSKESMLSWILQSCTQTNKEGRLMHIFKKIILNTNILGLVDALLVHYYILQINKQKIQCENVHFLFILFFLQMTKQSKKV